MEKWNELVDKNVYTKSKSAPKDVIDVEYEVVDHKAKK